MPTEPDDPELCSLLLLLSQGKASIEQVQQEIHRRQDVAIKKSTTKAVTTDSPLPELCIDLERAERCGFPEVIYAPGKSPEALVAGCHALLAQGQNALVTRCDADQADAVRAVFPQAISNTCARTLRVNCVTGRDTKTAGRVVVVTAGTSDRSVAEEALETLCWMEVDTELLMDVGVAGPQRFLQQKHRLRAAHAVIVVAGMEGALPSVVAGWVACPVIAVPTSVGYGAAFGGISALLGMLNSCAANVAVVNIDAGFKGGYLAGMIARQSQVCSPGGQSDDG